MLVASIAALSPPELNMLMASMFTPTAPIRLPEAQSPSTQREVGDHQDGDRVTRACGEEL